MASALVVGILAWLHILSAIGWLGSDIVLLIGMEPRLGKLSAAARDEFTTTVSPRINKMEMFFASATILFGLLFLYEFTGGDLSLISPSTQWGLAIMAGATLGFVAFLLEAFVDYPAEKMIIEIVRDMRANNRAPPPELSKYHERSEMVEIAVIILLFAAVTFMVAAGQL